MAEKTKILVVEDERIVAMELRAILIEHGYRVVATAASAEDALAACEAHRPDLVLMDIHLQGESDGIEAAGWIRKRYDLPIVFLTAYGDQQTLERAASTHPHGYLVKPFEANQLEVAIQMATHQYSIEQRLRDSEQRLSNILHAISDCMTITDASGDILWANQVLELRLGYSPVGRRFSTIFEAIDSRGEQLIPRVVFQGTDIEAIMRGTSPGGGEATYLVKASVAAHGSDGRISQILTIARDITDREADASERAQMAQRLQELQRLEALESLAAGVAHDFNNSLQTILGSIALASTSLARAHEVQADLRMARDTAMHAADIANQMLVFAGSQPFRPKTARLDKFVDEFLASDEAREFREIKHLSRSHDTLPEVFVDLNLFRQLLFNLLHNALEATEDRPSRVRIQTDALTLDADALGNAIPGDVLRPGEYAIIEVQDSGCGMSEETQRRMFDPFFSTKFVGRGLGLATTLGIVRMHSGAMKVRSAPDQGTSVTVIIPSHRQETLSPITAQEPEEVGLNPHPAILLVDDEPTVLAVIGRHLERVGYQVHTAQDYETAIELFTLHQETLCAGLIDYVMPGRDGVDISKELRQQLPKFPIVVMSGYPHKDVRRRLELIPGGCAFIQKPYEISELMTLLDLEIQRLSQGES